MEKEKTGVLEERLELNKPVGWFLNRKVPRGVGWWYTLGSATMVAFIIQIVTGIFLMMNYSPSPDHAYDSITYIMNNITFGALIRSIHFYSASAMVGLLVLHLMRVFFMAAHRYPRELTWVVGVVLFILVLGASFTGYLLPWDQRAYWATNVATGIAGATPLIGPWLQKLLIGGDQIGAITLTRFFTFHIGVIPVLIGLLIGTHVFMVVRQGISAPPGNLKIDLSLKNRREAYQKAYEASKKGGHPFFPDTVAKDAIVAALLMVAVLVLAVISPHISEAPADPTSTTYNPRPEWYFLYFFQFLKLWPGYLEPVAAVLVPLIVVVVLFLVPAIDRGVDRSWSRRKVSIGTGVVVMVIISALGLIGAISAPARPEGEIDPLILKGQTVYRNINCAYCHAINGVGGAIGPDISNVGGKFTRQQLTGYLQNPDSMIPNSLHPKLQYTPDELEALVAYLRTLGAVPVFSEQAPQLFAQNCSMCHVVNGQGINLGPDLSAIGARQTENYLAGYITNPKAYYSASTMPGYKGTLTPEQITDIAAYLSSLKGQAAQK